MSYGITPQMLPFDKQGNIDVERGNRMIDQWIVEEREAARRLSNDIIPTGYCVLIGKGYGFVHFPGNLFLAEIAERNRATHASTSQRIEKSKLSRTIVEYIREVRGGLFLKRSPVDELGKWKWIHATNPEANDKVAQIFRKPRRIDVDTSKESVLHTFADGRTLFVPPPERMEEWENILLPE